MRDRSDADAIDVARALPVDAGYISDVLGELTAIGSTPLGFRNAGTIEDRAVAEAVADRMSESGLSDVAIEPVEVDAWRFLGAEVRTDAGVTFPASTFGGVPPTPDGGITAPLVDAGDPRRSRLDRLDLDGKVALVDWKTDRVAPAAFAFELARRGVLAMIVNCPPGAPWYQGEGALGSFDGYWPAAGPPMVVIANEDAAELRHTRPAKVTVTMRAEVSPRSAGFNTVGYLRGEQDGPIVVGAHHDAWFRGAFDNTSGVAAMLALARAFVTSGHRPRHTVCFTSRTAEEFGKLDSPFDWCIGAWRQLENTHPEWRDRSPFHLCLEASGHRELRTIVEAPIELRGWARRLCRQAEQQGWTPTGWRLGAPVAGTEQWPYLVSGVPGVASYAWDTSYAKTDYHTQRDTVGIVDAGIVAAQTRLYALLLASADADPDAAFDHRARARQLVTIATRHGHQPLAEAARSHSRRSGRAAFQHIGRALLAVDAHGSTCYPHEQTARDLAALDAALAALARDDRRTALRQVRRVGSNHLVAYLSEAAFADYTARYEPARIAGTWGSASHWTRSPDLWADAAGRLQVDALASARDAAADELNRRLDAMAHALTDEGTA